jgi:D-lactate dehydrogenase (cytochrome)
LEHYTLIEHHDDVSVEYSQYLDDESGIIKGKADRIYFPTSEVQIQTIMKQALEMKIPLTVSGGGTGISGGRVPLTGWILATDKIRSVSDKNASWWSDPDSKQQYQVKLIEHDDQNALLTVPVSMPLQSIQEYLRENDWFYLPDTTERSSFIGGNVATNASGARCFKYGSTRNWVHSLRVVLPNGSLLQLDRDQDNGSITSDFINLKCEGEMICIPRPTYSIPNVTKNVAGPVIRDDMHPIDLFIGTNGIFGITTEVTLRLKRAPHQIISMIVFCRSMDQALELIQLCQQQRSRQNFPIPMSVEYLDDRASNIMKMKDDQIPDETKSIVMLEQDIYSAPEMELALEYWAQKFDELNIKDTFIAQTHKEIEHHKELRHHVPEFIISLTKSLGQALVVTDYAVPENKIREIFTYAVEKGDEFEEFQNSSKDILGYAFFAHAGDSHIHLSLIPQSNYEAEYANSMMVAIMRKIVKMGGTIAAEHGLGKKKFEGKPALHLQYGESGIEEVTAMKIAIDPYKLLNPNNLVE